MLCFVLFLFGGLGDSPAPERADVSEHRTIFICRVNKYNLVPVILLVYKVEFDTILEGLRNLGGGGLNPPPHRYVTAAVRT